MHSIISSIGYNPNHHRRIQTGQQTESDIEFCASPMTPFRVVLPHRSLGEKRNDGVDGHSPGSWYPSSFGTIEEWVYARRRQDQPVEHIPC